MVQSADKTALDIPVESVDHYEPQGSIDGPSAPAYAVLDFGSNNFATLRNRLHGVSIQIAEQSFTSNSRTIPAGSFIVNGSAYQKLKAAVIPLGLTAVALHDKPSVHTHEAATPRVAIYSTWGSTQNVGWVRYAFDQFETPYQLIFKEQVQAGKSARQVRRDHYSQSRTHRQGCGVRHPHVWTTAPLHQDGAL